MSGLDEIINIIDSQQKQHEENIIKSAESRAAKIKSEGDKKAVKAYDEYKSKEIEKAERDYENSCNSIDAAMKRKLLACRVELIDSVIEKAIDRIKKLPDDVYFSMLARISEKYIRKGEGVLYLGERDLKRVPKNFGDKISSLAEKKGGTVRLAKEAADIDDGFILQYGLISENCSFRAIAESEKDGIRDIASRELFGQVK